MQYINHRGDVYYAYQGTTKTGKPKYFASKKESSPTATRAEELPSDFEFFENPMNATVVVRRRKKSSVTVAERNLLSRLALEHCQVACSVVIDGNALVVYAGTPLDISAMGLTMAGQEMASRRACNFEPGFRFNLTRGKERKFTIARYCYRSAIDDWWPLNERPDTLESVALAYLPHLGKESFFELI